MNNQSATYQIIAAVLAFTVLLVTTVPAGLHAQSLMSRFCLPTQPVEKAMDAHCDIPADQHHPVHNQDNKSEEDSTCNFVCSCSIDEAPVIPIATHVHAQKSVELQLPGKILFANVFNVPFTDNYDQSFIRFVTPPPLFLKNSSFLN